MASFRGSKIMPTNKISAHQMVLEPRNSQKYLEKSRIFVVGNVIKIMVFSKTFSSS